MATKPWLDSIIPSKIESDLTNGPLSTLLELLDTQVEGSVQWILLEISWNYGWLTGMLIMAEKKSLYLRCIEYPPLFKLNNLEITSASDNHVKGKLGKLGKLAPLLLQNQQVTSI